MSSMIKFACLAGDIALKLHNFNTDDLRVYLTNTLPISTNTVYNTPADLTTSGGYTAGGQSITNSYSQTGGLGTLGATTIVWTATTGFGPFQYAVLYNNTAGAKNLIGWWDNGASKTLAALEVFTLAFPTSKVMTIQ